MVTLEPAVVDEGTCKFETATAVAANAKAAMALKGRGEHFSCRYQP
jgi:hypothetical protein